MTLCSYKADRPHDPILKSEECVAKSARHAPPCKSLLPASRPSREKLVDQNHAESQRAHVQSNTVHDQLAEDGLSNADLLVSIRKKSNREVKGKVTLGTHTAKSHICEEVLPIAAVIIRDAISLYSNNQAPVISPMITTTRFSQLH